MRNRKCPLARGTDINFRRLAKIARSRFPSVRGMTSALSALWRQAIPSVAFLVLGCNATNLPSNSWDAVPEAIRDAWPRSDIESPSPNVPQEFARFSGAWIAELVTGLPTRFQGRTVISVRAVTSDGNVVLSVASINRRWGGWQWDVVHYRGQIENGVLRVGASISPQFWLDFMKDSDDFLKQWNRKYRSLSIKFEDAEEGMTFHRERNSDNRSG